MSAFEAAAIQRLIDRAAAVGMPVPDEVREAYTVCQGGGSHGARLWLAAHPDQVDAEDWFCCWGAINGGPGDCTCWRPEYDREQTDPRPLAGPYELRVADGKCDDCAYRPGSPERRTDYEAEMLYALAAAGTPFYCHAGMRRPARWVHPDGHTIDGDPDDWTPPIVNGLPYQADGTPGLLCAGWAALAANARTTT